MKINKETLKKIIKEELSAVLSESNNEVEAALKEIIMWGEENGAPTPTMAVKSFIGRFPDVVEEQATAAGMNTEEYMNALLGAAENRPDEDENIGGFGSSYFDF